MLMGHGMFEAKYVGMQAETMAGIVAIAVLRVTTDGMAHIGSMDANLVLAPGLQLEFAESVCLTAFQDVEMSDGVLASIVGQ